MAKKLEEMTREELEKVSQGLTNAVMIVGLLTSGIAAYVAYLMMQGTEFKATLIIPLIAMMISNFPTVMRLAAVKKRLRELGR